MREAFIGIDLAIAKKKRLPVSICTWRHDRLVPEPLRQLSIEPPRGSGNAAVLDHALVQHYVEQASAYVKKACAELSVTPKRIAIDAPSNPRREGALRREAERAMDQAGISCFTTPTASEFETIFKKVETHLNSGGPENRIPHANQLWMFVGFQLYEELRQLTECIEVFPQATARVLGSGQVHKGKSGGVEAQLVEAARHTGWPSDDFQETPFEDIAYAPAHDRLDAYLSAWVAALDESERVAFGVPPDDVIWAPRLKGASFQQPVIRKPVKKQPAKKKSVIELEEGHSKVCPACGKHEFKRWPFGWDSHAAHTCEGLTSAGTAQRKLEFKQRFGHMFK